MTRIDMSRAEWHKSSYSNQNGACVEVARNPPRLATAARNHGFRVLGRPRGSRSDR
jgi:Domain of unknown function (DUF397)